MATGGGDPRRAAGAPWLGVGAAAALLAAAAIGFALLAGVDLETRLPWSSSARADADRATLLAARAGNVPIATWHTAAEDELLAEIRRITARPPPSEVEYILALRRGGTRHATLVLLTDALLGDDPLAATSVKGWLRRTPPPDDHPYEP